LCSDNTSAEAGSDVLSIAPWQNVKAADCVSFLEQLKQNIKGPIIVVWDRLQAHRSKKVQRYLIKQKGRITIAFFPPYSPDLNPIEYAWSFLKTKSMYNFAAENEEVLYGKAKNGLCNIRKQRRLLVAFLRRSSLFK
jgi:transposase